MCINFTNLNKACLKDNYPCPRIDQLVDLIASHELINFIDAYSGYHQIFMARKDKEKTSFIINQSTFIYNIIPFGLKNVGAIFYELINKIFIDYIGRNIKVYMDDIVVKSVKVENHVKDLNEVLSVLRKHRVKLNVAKSMC